jgi:hypothetical protein
MKKHCILRFFVLYTFSSNVVVQILMRSRIDRGGLNIRTQGQPAEHKSSHPTLSLLCVKVVSYQKNNEYRKRRFSCFKVVLTGFVAAKNLSTLRARLREQRTDEQRFWWAQPMYESWLTDVGLGAEDCVLLLTIRNTSYRTVHRIETSKSLKPRSKRSCLSL